MTEVALASGFGSLRRFNETFQQTSGQTHFPHVNMDDPVIARADGSPLYNFAVAVDDLDAGITHVVRGEDHLSNTIRQVMISVPGDHQQTPIGLRVSVQFSPCPSGQRGTAK